MELNALDAELVRRAEIELDARLQRMRELKAKGVVCDFLGRSQVTCEAKVPPTQAPCDKL